NPLRLAAAASAADDPWRRPRALDLGEAAAHAARAPLDADLLLRLEAERHALALLFGEDGDLPVLQLVAVDSELERAHGHGLLGELENHRSLFPFAVDLARAVAATADQQESHRKSGHDRALHDASPQPFERSILARTIISRPPLSRSRQPF